MNSPKTHVRTRFAPSPTGFLHIGGIRSALFNYLFAKKHGGDFVLRLEDTDRERFIPEAQDHLVESLKWLGIMADEGVAVEDGGYGPYVQSERLDLYRDHAEQLVAAGALYPCWCSPERLANLRTQAQQEKKAFKYDRHCLDHPQDRSEPHVLRFKVPEGQVVQWNDAVRGTIEFSTQDIDDFVAMKSDGFPTYQFANVVDDHIMEISHVLRADEWLPSTPKHVLLYEAFGWQHPIFAHLPAVVPPGGGKKLSKRHGAKSALELRDEGFVPDAVVNFLAMLGWNEGSGSTKEIYSRQELIDAFSLERIQKSPAVFDEERLLWFNGEYIRSVMSEEEYVSTARQFLGDINVSAFSDDYIASALLLDRERIKTFADIRDVAELFFVDPQWNSERIKLLTAKSSADEVRHWLEAVATKLQAAEQIEASIEQTLRATAEELAVPTGKLFYAIRVATTGRTAAPGLFETIHTLTLETAIRRLLAAKNALV